MCVTFRCFLYLTREILLNATFWGNGCETHSSQDWSCPLLSVAAVGRSRGHAPTAPREGAWAAGGWPPGDPGTHGIGACCAPFWSALLAARPNPTDPPL